MKKIYVNLKADNALCAQSDADSWSNRSSHDFAAKICSECPEQVDCYLTALVERRYGTWGGAWFPEEVLREVGSRAALYMRTGQGNVKLRKVLDLVVVEVCRRLGITKEEFLEEYGTGEIAIYKAVTGSNPRYKVPDATGGKMVIEAS